MSGVGVGVGCRWSWCPPTPAGLQKTVIRVQVVAPEKQFTLFFDDVRVPADNLVGARDERLPKVFMGLNPERIMGAALGTGIGPYALGKACAYARERQVNSGQRDRRILGVAHPLSHAKIQVEFARLIDDSASPQSCMTPGRPETGEAANTAKYAAAEVGTLALDHVIQTHGGNLMATEYGLATLRGPARLMRCATRRSAGRWSSITWPGTAWVCLGRTDRRALGLGGVHAGGSAAPTHPGRTVDELVPRHYPRTFHFDRAVLVPLWPRRGEALRRRPATSV